MEFLCGLLYDIVFLVSQLRNLILLFSPPSRSILASFNEALCVSFAGNGDKDIDFTLIQFSWV